MKSLKEIKGEIMLNMIIVPWAIGVTTIIKWFVDFFLGLLHNSDE